MTKLRNRIFTHCLAAIICLTFAYRTSQAATDNPSAAQSTSTHLTATQSIRLLPVAFSSSSFVHTLSPFKIRQAKKQGIELPPDIVAPAPLQGYFSLPQSETKSPAVVLLHTCAGLTEHERAWSDTLMGWGYAVLLVDSLATRPVDYICDDRVGAPSPWTRALDAHGGKAWLQDHPRIDATQIAVFGLSHGGASVLEAIRESNTSQDELSAFSAAVALYPLCSTAAKISSPLLIITGSEDGWTPVELCEDFERGMAQQHEILVETMEGAYHGFDHPGIDIVEMGHPVKSDQAASIIATQMIKEFLEKWRKAP